jgi:hypothetical protein
MASNSTTNPAPNPVINIFNDALWNNTTKTSTSGTSLLTTSNTYTGDNTFSGNNTFSGTNTFGNNTFANTQYFTNSTPLRIKGSLNDYTTSGIQSGFSNLSITTPFARYISFYVGGSSNPIAPSDQLVYLPTATSALAGLSITFRRVYNSTGNIATALTSASNNVYQLDTSTSLSNTIMSGGAMMSEIACLPTNTAGTNFAWYLVNQY